MNCIRAEVSGGLPGAMWVSAKAADELGGFAVQQFGWSGCLDAPDLMPAGSVLPVNISEAIGGMGYEGNVSSIVVRGKV